MPPAAATASRGSGAARRRGRGSAAFTLVEMLVVIAIIILLLSLLIVGLNKATKAAQAANTRSLMQSLQQGLVQFREDIGYEPPVLGAPAIGEAADLRALWEPPALDEPGYDEAIQDWFSLTSLAEYLIGYGDHNEDGYGLVLPEGGGQPRYGEESPAVGLRHPGPDGVWGASRGQGRLEDRAPSTPATGGPGHVYGPYVELDSNRLLASADGTFDPGTGGLNLFFPGESGFNPRDPRIIVDYWGEPVVYFRRNYPRGALGQSYRAGVAYTGNPQVDGRGVPTLADVIRLRPYTTDPGGAVDVNGYFADANGDTTASLALKSARVALFSSGPDRGFESTVRVDGGADQDQKNQDNLVEIEP